MKKKNSKYLLLSIIGILFSIIYFANTYKSEPPKLVGSAPASYIEVRAGKDEILVSSNDGVKNRQKALVGNLEVSYTDANENNSGWFRATEKDGVFYGNDKNFLFLTEDGYRFQIQVDGTTVHAVVSKEGAFALIDFNMNTHVKEASKENTMPSYGTGFEDKEEKNYLRQEVAKDNNATDVDEEGRVVGIQKPENIWDADKAQTLVNKGEATIIDSSSKTDLISKDDSGYHLEEVRPESDPTKHEEVEKGEPLKTKQNTFERISVLVEKGNVISAFSKDGGSGKLNLIVDHVNGSTYNCHAKDGSTYTIIIRDGMISLNNETYFF